MSISLKVVIYNYNILCVTYINCVLFLYLKIEKNCVINFYKLCHFIRFIVKSCH